jgi:anaerobic selenocysteine-containing dehydrogenase
MDVGAVTEGGMAAALDGAEVIFNLGADEVEIAPGAFVIYQGSHGDRGAHRADVILPAAAWTEEPGLFVNTEGRPQLAIRAGFPPGEAKENWAILRALSGELGAALPWDSLAALRLGGYLRGRSPDQVRATVIEYIASGSLGPQHADAISGVRGQLRASEPWVVDLAIGAVVHLGDTAAIPTLVELVGDTSAHTAQKAANALSSLTFQAHGVNQRRWERWFRRYGNAGREAWLLDAMVDRDRRVRENAQRALRQLPWAVNYDPDLDRRQLKLARRAVEKYLEG